MNRILYSAGARRDLANIRSFTPEAFGPEQAKRYIERIRSRCEAVRDGVLPAKIAPFGEGLRFHRSGSHFVFHYRTTANDLQVVRVLHRRMQFEDHL